MKKPGSRRKIRLIFLWIGFALLLQLILINISAALYAYKLTHLHIPDNEMASNQKPRNIFAKTWSLFTGPKLYKQALAGKPSFPFITIILKTKDSVSIETWYSKTDSISKGTVILFHGLRGNKGMILSEAAEFRELGYNVMLPDMRNHGNSGGDHLTYGYEESEEVKLTYDYVQHTGEKNIFLWGASLGAVEVTKAIYDYGLHPSGIIIEMPFLSLRSHLKWQGRSLNFPGEPFALLTSFWIGVENGFNGWGLRTDKYAKKIHCPVLLQYGKSDIMVSEKETRCVYQAVVSSNKKLVIYENAGHESFFKNDPVTWVKEVKDFLDSNKAIF